MSVYEWQHNNLDLLSQLLITLLLRVIKHLHDHYHFKYEEHTAQNPALSFLSFAIL
jgi:hypothetical protein